MAKLDEYHPCYRHTPLLPCPPHLSRRYLNSARAFFKLENLQPSGSFKDRGISTFIAAHLNKWNGQCEFVCSSSGNAGVAAATACHQFHAKCTVFVPSITPQLTRDRLTELGATIVAAEGDMWPQAHAALLEYVKGKDDSGVPIVTVHPFDDDLVWKGHSSMAREIFEDLGGRMPDAVVAVVGGGGLLIGLADGFTEIANENGVEPPTLVAVETFGAESFHNAVNGKKYPLDGITSVAKSLGATKVADRLLDIYNNGRPDIRSVVVTDKDAVLGVVKFAEEMRMLVEPACGAGLSLMFSDDKPTCLSDVLPLGLNSTVVFVVCGGSSVNFELIQKWRSENGAWPVHVSIT
ncbi:putative L-serine ammonia-lyase [Cladochytrium replicatum]|nr:putative L-serine ammonia-lyase [Cladochytrium replicatum]